MDGHVPDEPEGYLCRHGFPTSPRHAGILPNAQRKENSERTTYTMAELSRVGCTTVRDISLGTGGYSLQKLGPDHSGTNHSCPVDAQGSNGEKYTGDLTWPWYEDQEISWTQLPRIQNSLHPRQPSRTYSMSKFENWL